MREKPVTLYLKELEKYRIGHGLSRTCMAAELGVPENTYRNWYREHKKHAKPSAHYGKWLRRFLAYKKILSADKWILGDGPSLLRAIGFTEGQVVVDFGSGDGDYTVILARIVGNKGKVYAVDKNRETLGGVMGRGYAKGLQNIEPIFVSAKQDPPTDIPVRRRSIDAIWFSDVLHDGYFKEDDKKEKLLESCRSVLRKKGFIAVHPVHMEEKRLKSVIQRIGFRLEREYRRIVMFHGEEFHKASIFKYRKA